jgi:hypothetical protein
MTLMSQTTQRPTRPAGQPFVVGPDGGEHVWFLATRMTIKATAQTTAGALGVVEWHAAPGFPRRCTSTTARTRRSGCSRAR